MITSDAAATAALSRLTSEDRELAVQAYGTEARLRKELEAGHRHLMGLPLIHDAVTRIRATMRQVFCDGRCHVHVDENETRIGAYGSAYCRTVKSTGEGPHIVADWRLPKTGVQILLPVGLRD